MPTSMDALIQNALIVVVLLLLLGTLPVWPEHTAGVVESGDILEALLLVPFALWLAWAE